MEERNRTDFAKWMEKQFRLAGEELIRRSETMDFTGWDGITDISVSINIPTYKDDIEAPSFDVTFSCLNIKAIDDLVSEHRQFVTPINEKRADSNMNRLVCPVCGGDLQSLTMTAPPKIKLICQSCGMIIERRK